METDLNSTIDRILLSVEEASSRLGLSKSYMHTLVRTGVIPSFKVGKLRKIKPEDLETFKDGLEVDAFEDSYLNS